VKIPFEAHNSSHTAAIQIAVHRIQVNARQ
jgi:hypothetical protein